MHRLAEYPASTAGVADAGLDRGSPWGIKLEPAGDIAGPFSGRAQSVDSTPAQAPAKTAPAPIPFSPAPAAGGFNAAPQISAENTILVPLSALAEKWPDAIKMELVQTDLMGAKVALPAALIEAGLKRGRVTILWKSLRMMIRPKPAAVSIHDGVEVELPLKVLAPLAVVGQKPSVQTRQKVSVSDEIPDLFHSFKQAGAAAAPAPTPAPAPVARTAPVPPVAAAPVPIAPAKAVVPAQPAVPAEPAAPERETISAPLAALAEKWPDAIKRELVQADLMGAQADLPASLIEPGLKRGRVLIPWKNLRMMIRPKPAPVSVHDSVEIELPLKVLAPLFFSSQKAAGMAKQKVSVDANIPDLFQGSKLEKAATSPMPAPASAPAPQPAPAPAASTKAADTNYFSKFESPSDTEFKRQGSSGTDFTSRGATPGEVVSRAMALPGVAGAVVALYDGLMIASQVPPELNADTVAAFLPQIFSRTGQSAKELRMGELNNLTFTVGNVPWKIFRVNALYFAAFGRAGEAMPAAPLAALAAQLDRKKQ